MGLWLPGDDECGWWVVGGADGPYLAKQLLSHYTVPYDQLSFPDLNIHPYDEGVTRRQALSGHR